ncbi:gamma-glutamylcyclotransferase family protein [Psychromonas sp. MME2]|uniref:gamma-glutamylcyclotransferase family protein n=1 Tax=unclassified Psychromonas TaxID=2614957 RepID=UPI00339C44C7
MSERLFVYGTLAPGRENEHLLASVSGEWQVATVRGKVLDGWGACEGYPVIILDDKQSLVHGLLFTSCDLSMHWQRLDEFEGEGYERVSVCAELADGSRVEAYIYALSTHIKVANSAAS